MTLYFLRLFGYFFPVSTGRSGFARDSMIQFALTIAAGLSALIGLGAIAVAATARTARRNHLALRTAQAGLTLAGLLMLLGYFAIGDQNGLFGGLMLIFFGTGMTAVRRRSDPSA